jgi:cytochrome c oxidase assembly factor CtaG
VTVTSRAVGTANGVEKLRRVLALTGLVLWVVALVPPVADWARQFQYAQAIQFGVFALAVPALVVTGAPWSLLRLSSGDRQPVGGSSPMSSPRFMDRFAERAARRSGHVYIFTVGLIYLAMVIAWRTAPVVDAMVHHGWLAVLEAVSLTGGGVVVWLTIVESPPVHPSTTRPFRIGVAAVVMWTIWVIAYMNGMSQSSWYGAFAHPAGSLSLSADQEFAAAALWFISAASLMPVVFWNLVHWLQSEEDPNEELSRLVRESRLRGTHDASA